MMESYERQVQLQMCETMIKVEGGTAGLTTVQVNDRSDIKENPRKIWVSYHGEVQHLVQNIKTEATAAEIPSSQDREDINRTVNSVKLLGSAYPFEPHPMSLHQNLSVYSDQCTNDLVPTVVGKVEPVEETVIKLPGGSSHNAYVQSDCTALPVTSGPTSTAYPCPHCSRTFTLAAEIEQHLQSHDDEESLDDSELDDSELTTGRKRAGRKGKYDCPVCNAVFGTRQGLNCHEKVHSKAIVKKSKKKRKSSVAEKSPVLKKSRKKAVTCEVCQCDCCDEDELCEHLMEYHVNMCVPKKSAAKNAHRCDKCDSTFPTKYALSIHKNTHKWTRYTCTICQRDLTPVVSGDINGRFPCGSCGLQTASYIELSTHMKEHIGIKLPLLCLQCNTSGKYTSPPSRTLARNTTASSEHQDTSFECLVCQTLYHNRSVEVHMRNHALSKEICHICNRRFPTQRYLTEHLVIHDRTSAAFSCQICGVDFSPRGKRSAAGQFRCGACDERCQNMVELRKHMKDHLGEAKAFVCFKCGEKKSRKK